MENLLQQLINLVIALVCWILLAAVGKPLNEGLGNVQKGIGDLFEAVIKLLERAGGGAHQTSSTAQQTNKKFWQGVEAIFNKIIDALNTVTSVLRGHWSEVADQLGSRENRPWRVIGALVYLAAMIVFVYADMIQGANNVAALFRDIDLGLPDFLTNLVIPLLTASVGSAVMLGMIIGDFIGLSSFAPWERLKGRARTSYFVLSVLSLTAVLICSILLAMTRFGLTASLPPSVADTLNTWAAFAQSAVILPMLLATFLLVPWGLGGLLVIWLVIVGTWFLLLQLIRLSVEILSIAISLGGGGSNVVLKVLFALLSVILIILMSSLRFTMTTVNLLFVGLESILKIVIYPIVSLGEWATRYDWVRKNLKIGPQGGTDEVRPN